MQDGGTPDNEGVCAARPAAMRASNTAVVALPRPTIQDVHLNGPSASSGLLGDTAQRDYSRKLRLFSGFAEPELRAAITDLGLKPGMRVLDAGCGTGEALKWLAEEIGPSGAAIGFDLATAHVASAAAYVPRDAFVVQANLLRAPFRPHIFDLIWCVNTIHHLRDPIRAVSTLTSLARAGGRIVLGQSSLVPEMYFAWDSRLERVTNEAVRQYYRDRYGLSERALTHVRALVGWLRAIPLRGVTVRTVAIERISPLRPADEAYLLEVIFRGTWGERLRPYLSGADYAELVSLCDPNAAQFALRRPDFHFLQCFTLVIGET
jgi:SAM-dependent methyltransferase